MMLPMVISGVCGTESAGRPASGEIYFSISIGLEKHVFALNMNPDEKGLLSSSKYKTYADEVQSALDLYEKSKEWADLIKWLQRLSKVLSKHTFSIIPHKMILSRRLAQCLNPTLPSGVHLKALETYSLIFDKIKGQLAADLGIYSLGIFPLFQFGATQVKAKILDTYETYYLPLRFELTPCLSGFITSLLPGLEDETSEFYGRVLAMLDSTCSAVHPQLFFYALWKCVLMSKTARLPAINYLLQRFPKSKTLQDVDIFLPDRNTLVLTALQKSLKDSNVLVQRSALEFINVHLPLHFAVSVFAPIECAKLVEYTLSVLLRREMSLNRRIYSWLGIFKNFSDLIRQAGNTDEDPNYFLKHGKDVTITALKNMFAGMESEEGKDASGSGMTVPYLVLMNLLDKEDIGAAIIDDVLIDVMRTLYKYREASFSHKIIKSVSLLFDQLEPQMFWGYLQSRFEKDVTSNPEQLETIRLIDGVLDIMSLNEIDVQYSYLPTFIFSLVNSLQVLFESGNINQLCGAFQLCLKLIGKLQAKSQSDEITTEPESDENDSLSKQDEDILKYQTTQTYTAFFNAFINTLFKKFSLDVQSESEQVPSAMIKMDDSHLKAIDMACQVLVSVHTHFRFFSPRVKKKSGMGVSLTPKGRFELPQWIFLLFSMTEAPNATMNSLAIRSIIGLLTFYEESDFLWKFHEVIINSQSIYSKTLAKRLWYLLDSCFCNVHYQVAELFLELVSLCEEVVTEVIADAMSTSVPIADRVQAYQRFALLWRLTGELGSSSRQFSQILFIMLDSLTDEQPMIKLVGRTWAGDSIQKPERILDPLFRVLLEPCTTRSNGVYQKMYDTRRVLHVFRILRVVMEMWSEQSTMQRVMEKQISRDILALNAKQVLENNSTANIPTNNENIGVDESDVNDMPLNNYLDLLVITSLRFIQGKIPENASNGTSVFPTAFCEANGVVQATAAEFLSYLLVKISNSTPIPVNSASQQTHITGNTMQSGMVGTFSTDVNINPASTNNFPGLPNPDSSRSRQIASMIQEAILQYLAEAVSQSNLVLQVHLLGLLRVVAILNSYNGSNDFHRDTILNSQMFLQTLVVGLLQPSSKNIRFYWLEFIATTIRHFRRNLQAVVTPIIKCVCSILLSETVGKDIYDSMSARDILILLKALHIILSYSIAATYHSPNSFKGSSGGMNLGTALGAPVRMLTDFVKAFTDDADDSPFMVPPLEDNTTLGSLPSKDTMDAIMKDLPMILQALVQVWAGGTTYSNSQEYVGNNQPNPPMKVGNSGEWELHNKYAIQDEIVRILDPFAQKYTTTFMEAVLNLWIENSLPESMIQNPNVAIIYPKYNLLLSPGQEIILDILNQLESATPDTLLSAASILLASIHASAKQSSSSNLLALSISSPFSPFPLGSSGVSPTTPSVGSASNVSSTPQKKRTDSFAIKSNKVDSSKHEVLLLEMLCCFIGRTSSKSVSLSCSAESLNYAWPSFLELLKEGLNSLNAVAFLVLLRLLNIVMTKANVVEDKKLRKDLQEFTQKLIDVCVIVSGRFVGPSSNPPSVQNDNNTQEPSQVSENSEPSSPRKEEIALHTTNVNLKALLLLSQLMMPILDTVFTESNETNVKQDKVYGILFTVVHSIVPYLRDRSPGNFAVTYAASSLLNAIANYPFTLRSWKKEVMDLFYDSDFFYMNYDALSKWKNIIDQFMKDKGAFQDLIKIIAKSMTTQPMNLFVNREQELLIKSRNMKRLSFAIYGGAIDQYLSHISAIHERILEALKYPNAPTLYAQVFLCLRVLLLKVTPIHLRSLWPAILTEMIRIFTQENIASENEVLVLAACKFLDQLFILPLEEFNLVEWIFVADSVRNTNLLSDSMLPSYITMIDKLSSFGNANPFSTTTASFNNKDGWSPLITIRSYSDIEIISPQTQKADFVSFVDFFLSHWTERHNSFLLSGATPNYQALFRVIEGDFIEFGTSILNDFNNYKEPAILSENFAKRLSIDQDWSVL